jgi:hypothetical protein
MARTFGVVSRYRAHLRQFATAFFEVKDVGGAWHDPIAGTIPMVSCFGDNRVARAHPDWVQEGPKGLRAVRTERYFDWDALCPTRPEVQELARAWIRRAGAMGTGFRLDDVSYARDGFCQCAVCRNEADARSLSLPDLHRAVLTEFVESVRQDIGHPVYFTLYPDPFPGHLESRYGLSLDALTERVDAFVVPLYDLAYTTTYWLEILVSAWRERVPKGLFIELYGLNVPEAALAQAMRVAAHYADGVLIAYESKLDKLLRLASLFADEQGVPLEGILREDPPDIPEP